MARKVGSQAQHAAELNAPVSVDQTHSALGTYLQAIDLYEEQVARCVAILRSYGKSWAYVGRATGLTPEGARQKYQLACEEMGVPRRVTAAEVPQLVAALPTAGAIFGRGR